MFFFDLWLLSMIVSWLRNLFLLIDFFVPYFGVAVFFLLLFVIARIISSKSLLRVLFKLCPFNITFFTYFFLSCLDPVSSLVLIWAMFFYLKVFFFSFLILLLLFRITADKYFFIIVSLFVYYSCYWFFFLSFHYFFNFQNTDWFSTLFFP